MDLAIQGHQVTVVEALDGVARDLNGVSIVSLLRLLNEHGVRLLTGHCVT